MSLFSAGKLRKFSFQVQQAAHIFIQGKAAYRWYHLRPRKCVQKQNFSPCWIRSPCVQSGLDNSGYSEESELPSEVDKVPTLRSALSKPILVSIILTDISEAAQPSQTWRCGHSSSRTTSTIYFSDVYQSAYQALFGLSAGFTAAIEMRCQDCQDDSFKASSAESVDNKNSSKSFMASVSNCSRWFAIRRTHNFAEMGPQSPVTFYVTVAIGQYWSLQEI